jgi:hypothetical protein
MAKDGLAIYALLWPELRTKIAEIAHLDPQAWFVKAAFGIIAILIFGYVRVAINTTDQGTSFQNGATSRFFAGVFLVLAVIVVVLDLIQPPSTSERHQVATLTIGRDKWKEESRDRQNHIKMAGHLRWKLDVDTVEGAKSLEVTWS